MASKTLRFLGGAGGTVGVRNRIPVSWRETLECLRRGDEGEDDNEDEDEDEEAGLEHHTESTFSLIYATRTPD